MDFVLVMFITILLVLVSTIAYIVLTRRSFCTAVFSSRADLQLELMPNELDLWHISFIVTTLILKSVVQSIGWGPKLLFDVENNSSFEKEGGQLRLLGQQSKISMPFQITKTVIANYEKATGTTSFDAEIDSIEETGLLFSAASTPAILLLLAKWTCPIRPLGAVNVRSRFEILDPNACRVAVLAAQGATIYAEARLLPVARKVKRGYEFDLMCDVISEATKSSIFRQTFTMLQFAQHAKQSQTSQIPKSDQSKLNDPRDPTKDVTFDVAYNDPSLWALICKDYNPIHISKFAAKCFGFRSKIAHGTLVVAKALAAMKGIQRKMQSSSMVVSQTRDQSEFTKPRWIEVDFKRPMLVPAKFVVSTPRKSDTKRNSAYLFQIYRSEKTFIDVRMGDMDD